MSNKKEKNIQVQFRLLKVNTVSFRLNHPHKKFDSKKEAVIEYLVEPIINDIVKNHGEYIMTIKINCSIIETQEVFCEIITRFQFFIINFKNKLKKVKGGYSADLGLVSTLLAISLSTTRGILIERSYNTILQKECLPTMNIDLFFQKSKLPTKKEKMGKL